MGLNIRKDKLVQYIQAFWRNSSFFIQIKYEGAEAPANDTPVVTSQVSTNLQMFLSQKYIFFLSHLFR